MNEDPIIQDTSRVDNYLRSRHRVEVLNSAWKPALAGGLGATAIIGAVVVGVWVAGPRFSYQEVIVPRVVMKDSTVPNIIMKDVEIPVPKIVETQPLARTPDEERFVSSADWANADVRGRILRADKNGFDLTTEDGRETSFFPARIRPDGKVETNEGMRDIVEPFLNDLAVCRPMPTGVYLCIAEHEGREIPIKQIPIKRGRPT